MSNFAFKAFHKKHGMIYPDEDFDLEDAIEGHLSFFGSPSKDYSPDDFTYLRYINFYDK